MKNKHIYLKRAYVYANVARFIPLISFMYLSPKRKFIREERNIWIDKILNEKTYNLYQLFWLLTFVKEYRSVLYFRLGKISKLISIFAPGEKMLFMASQDSKKVGLGIVIHHGHSTRIGAKAIGKDCQIWHNVTIGANRSHVENSRPTIGNNVKITTGAIVLGPINVGDNVVIAAGAVVTKNVPNNCVVVGNPAYIVKQDGVKVHIKL